MMILPVHVAAAAVLAAALAAGGAFALQDWRWAGRLHKAETAALNLRTETAEQRQRAAGAALETYARMEATKNAAIEAATARAVKNEADAAGLRRQLGSMQRDLATVPDRIAAASRAAVNEYAAAATVVFQQCSRQYAEVAAAADGHANDAAACRAAWPVSSKN